MKKFFAILAFVAFTGLVANAQSSSTDTKAPEKKEQEVKKCTEAEKAQCEKDAAKTGAKCETHSDAKTEKACSGSKSGGSCCSKGTTSAGGSCCQKGGATGSTGSTENAAPTDEKKSKKTKTVAAVTAPEKK